MNLFNPIQLDEYFFGHDYDGGSDRGGSVEEGSGVGDG